jgi:hypothetical protein
MNVNETLRLLEVPGGVPEALQQAFRDMMNDTTRGEDRRLTLTFRDVAFTRVLALFVHDFLRNNPRAVGHVEFCRCRFKSKECVHLILKDAFATMNGLKGVAFCDDKMPLHCNAAWLPLVAEFATELNVDGCSLGDTGFNKLVDYILGGNGKTNLKRLKVSYNLLSPHSLKDATRLIKLSQLEHLNMSGNNYILNDQEQVQLLCEELKRNKFLRHVEFLQCHPIASTAVRANTTMLLDVLEVNTTLTNVRFTRNFSDWDDIVHFRRLDPWIRRNKVLAGVQGLLHPANNNNNNNNQQHQQHHHQLDQNESDNEETHNIVVADNEITGRLFLLAATEHIDHSGGRSALFLLMRHAIVGDGQEQGARPLFEMLVEAFQASSSLSTPTALQ